MAHRPLRIAAVTALGLIAAAAIGIAVFGWNWARAPLQRSVLEHTGRVLSIGGDLHLGLGWPALRVRAGAVSFANPAWAQEKQMIVVDEIDLGVDLPALLRGKLVFADVHLTRPVVALEHAADGRKTWLLDAEQSDESARATIGALTLDDGRLSYEDAAQRSQLRLEVSSTASKVARPVSTAASAVVGGITFSASGLYKGQALTARGSGDSVLALRDASRPYHLTVQATLGRTAVDAVGSITSLLEPKAIDLQLTLRGESLASLYPLVGVAFPDTKAYVTTGRLVRSGTVWRYDEFVGRFGKSDLSGSLKVDVAGARPAMSGTLMSSVLDMADLGPMIGAAPGPAAAPAPAKAVPAAVAASGSGRQVLPEIPFDTARWRSVDADVALRARTILRVKALPLDNLVTHLTLRDAQLSLDPLDVGMAGGHLKAVISLDGRQSPIRAQARVGVRQLQLARLFPTLDLQQASLGLVNGDFDLRGQGNAVDRMLATADGRVALVVERGVISRLLMEKIGLHLIEILQLQFTGDRPIALRCGIADFSVKQGRMTAQSLIFDTDVSTLVGSGQVELGPETLDLTLVPKTRNTSLVALRGPIYVRGTFSRPEVSLDKGQIAVRGLGALALGLVNPLLALLPLIETGPGVDSDCGRLVRAAQAKPAASAAR